MKHKFVCCHTYIIILLLSETPSETQVCLLPHLYNYITTLRDPQWNTSLFAATLIQFYYFSQRPPVKHKFVCCHTYIILLLLSETPSETQVCLLPHLYNFITSLRDPQWSTSLFAATLIQLYYFSQRPPVKHKFVCCHTYIILLLLSETPVKHKLVCCHTYIIILLLSETPVKHKFVCCHTYIILLLLSETPSETQVCLLPHSYNSITSLKDPQLNTSLLAATLI